MSKKSHPGDGQHGKGVKGEEQPFAELFEDKARQRQPEVRSSEAEGAPSEED